MGDGRWPRMEAYLASVPGGMEAHASCEQKGSIVRHVLDTSPSMKPHLHDLPREVRALVEEPPLASAWVREVHATALYLAVCDAHFASDDAYVQHSHRLNKSLLESPLYRVLMFVVSPPLVLRDARTRWGALHRGSTLHVAQVGSRSYRVTLQFPTRMIPRLLARCLGTAFQVVVEGSGGRGGRVELQSCDDSAAVYEARW